MTMPADVRGAVDAVWAGAVAGRLEGVRLAFK
jgi:hypothetical protein